MWTKLTCLQFASLVVNRCTLIMIYVILNKCENVCALYNWKVNWKLKEIKYQRKKFNKINNSSN